MRLPSEKPTCPSRRTPSAVRTASGRRQPERGGKGCWDAEQPDRDGPCGGTARIASQPLLPAETIPCALCARQDHVGTGWRSGGGRRQAHLQALVAHELQAGTPMGSAAPIALEQRGRPHLQRMQEHAHLPRLCGGGTIPLARLAQWTGTTTANARRIHDTQTPIGLSAALLNRKRLPCWTAERPVGLERKVGSAEAPRFPGRGSGRWTVSSGRSGGGRTRGSWLTLRREGRSKLGGAQGSRLQVMPQFQAEVPHPLRHALPGFLSPGRVTAPPIGVEFLILIGKRRLKGAAMQIQLNDVTGAEGTLRQSGEEEFVHDPCTRDADRTLLLPSGMRCHDDTAWHAFGSHWNFRAVVETAHGLAFWTLLELIRRQVQTRRDARVIKHAVLFPTGHKREPSHIGERSPSPVLAVEPEQSAFRGKLVCSQIPAD